MIRIVEGKSKKCPCRTSLFYKMDFYDPYLFGCLCQTDGSNYDKVNRVFEFPSNTLAFIVELLSRYDSVSFMPMRDPVVKQTAPVSKSKFKYPPYKHQLEAVEYGVNRDGGWLLLDECGLGKTISMIYLAEELKRRENLEHCFIVCGVNGLKYNWEAEIAKYSKLSCCILGQKINKRGNKVIGTVAERVAHLKGKISEFFVITNIETLQNKLFADAFKKSKTKFDMIVLDEAHHAKNPTSQSVKTLLKMRAKRCIALTGTVLMNVPENAFVPLKWTGNTQTTFGAFKGFYNVYGGFGGKQVIGHKNLNVLQSFIASCSLRRLKSDVLDLPPKTYKIDYVEMGAEQRKLYDEVADGIGLELDRLSRIPTVMEEITINMRLRQVTAFPGAVSTVTDQSAKLDRLCDLVRDIVAQGDKVVVLGTFKSAMKEAFNRLSEYSPVLCTGDNTPESINQNKDRFNNDDNCKVFIATWQKMGTGHTLNAANYLIFVDTPWTQADFDQSADRVHRIGQNKSVFIITLVTKDTYDERVLEILERKEVLSGYVVDGKFEEKLSMIGE